MTETKHANLTLAGNDAQVYLQVAARIGHQLCRDAFWDGTRCTWLGWNMEFLGGQWVTAYTSCGPQLYAGTAGIALFLAELYAKTGDMQVKRTLEGAVNQILPLLAGIQGPQRIGFYSGVSGIAWAMARIADILQHEGLQQRALGEMRSLLQIAPDAQMLDVIGGSAGVIPALLQMATCHDQADLRELACRHGEHLLQLAIHRADGWSWDTMHVPGQPPLTGHSHGAAGVVTALLELYVDNGDERFLAGAEQGLRYEQSLFSAQHGNWPDLRNGMGQGAQSQACYNLAWCHGAPGIGLSRLRCLELLGAQAEQAAQLERDLQAALKTTADALAHPYQPGMGNFSLCHGACGNAELLLLAAQRRQEQAYWPLLHKIAREGCENFAFPELPWPCGVAGAGENPSLMLGLAGIGHFYLRLYDPQAVPSALIILPQSAGQGEQILSKVA